MTLLGVARRQLKIRVGKLRSQDKLTTELPRAVYLKEGFIWNDCEALDARVYDAPGTGKLSLAAMAKYLKFDVYDLELTSIPSKSDLRKALLGDQISSSLAMLICYVTHGLRSSCGVERIVEFTTNHKDKPDPALFRPGRIDMLINMSYCSNQGFRLVSNYLDVHDQHPLLEQIDSLEHGGDELDVFLVFSVNHVHLDAIASCFWIGGLLGSIVWTLLSVEPSFWSSCCSLPLSLRLKAFPSDD
ncbi:Mitochondrial chaperone BCS1-like protein [Theobroma cacao]|uniref:Mitochondrial chaperone BCS1-like protein n=1 Tax=Theobroma cacao TaxID=3641 RepID=A0A061DLY7_THECC|nr:Mitochondrial chaperone BCS1-like protein [Theobroma cacao]